jgi:hypothetical protein
LCTVADCIDRAANLCRHIWDLLHEFKVVLSVYHAITQSPHNLLQCPFWAGSKYHVLNMVYSALATQKPFGQEETQFIIDVYHITLDAIFINPLLHCVFDSQYSITRRWVHLGKKGEGGNRGKCLRLLGTHQTRTGLRLRVDKSLCVYAGWCLYPLCLCPGTGNAERALQVVLCSSTASASAARMIA